MLEAMLDEGCLYRTNYVNAVYYQLVGFHPFL